MDGRAAGELVAVCERPMDVSGTEMNMSGILIDASGWRMDLSGVLETVTGREFDGWGK